MCHIQFLLCADLRGVFWWGAEDPASVGVGSSIGGPSRGLPIEARPVRAPRGPALPLLRPCSASVGVGSSIGGPSSGLPIEARPTSCPFVPLFFGAQRNWRCHFQFLLCADLLLSGCHAVPVTRGSPSDTGDSTLGAALVTKTTPVTLGLFFHRLTQMGQLSLNQGYRFLARAVAPLVVPCPPFVHGLGHGAIALTHPVARALSAGRAAPAQQRSGPAP